MAEPTPGTRVIDRRTHPRGALPRNAQTWLMAGLAAAILAIIGFFGRPMPVDPPPPAPAPPQAPSPDRLRDYQDRLRLMDERARQSQAQPTPVGQAFSRANSHTGQDFSPANRAPDVPDARPSPAYDPSREQQREFEEEKRR